MTDKTEGPSKESGRTADGPGAKRPHATIDLKATDVTPPQKNAEAAAAPATPTKDAPTTSQAGQAGSTKPGDKDKPADAKAQVEGKSKPDAPKTDIKPEIATKPSPDVASKPAGGSGVGRLVSHLAAGVVGGAVVYGAAAYLPDPSRVPAAELETRLAALENAQSSSTVSVGSQLKSAQSQLKSLSETIALLGTEQQRLANDTKAALEKPEGDGAAAELKGEIAQLQERLEMIAKGADASDGRVPQLAAVTGKVADLEASIANQIAALRNTVPADLDARLAAVQEASEAAKSGAQRLDRELAQLRTETAKLAQQDATTNAESQRLAAAVEAAQAEAGKLASAVNELRGMIENRVAKPADVSAAVAPVASKLAALENSLADVVKSEEERKSNAERIVLSLELANLKRALDRGEGYVSELKEVQKAAQGRIDLAALEKYSETGVPKLAELESEFRPVLNAVIDADQEPADASFVDRMLSGAKSIVRVRKVGHDPNDTSAEAVVGRIEAALKAGQLGVVLAEAKTLPQRASAPIQGWLDKVAARNAVDRALAAIEAQLKASLSGSDPAAETIPAATGTN